MGEYEDALASAGTSVRRPNAQFWAFATYTAALGHLGRFDEARAARNELFRLKAEFSCNFVRQYVYYNTVPAHLERYIEGLKKAGVE